MTPEELEALKGSDPERYEALTGPQRDRQLAAAAVRRGDPLYSSEHDPLRPTPYERQARAEREAARAIGEPEPPVYGLGGGWLPLSSEIVVSFNGSHFDLSRLRGGGPDCAVDLAAIYTELFNRLRDKGLHFRPPANNTVTWAEEVTGPGGMEALGGWDPETRNFVLHADLALVPELVRDVVAHEMVHQLMSEHPQPLDHTRGGHGDRFYHVALVVAEALELPEPNLATVAVWPTLDRPRGYYGPLVGYRPQQAVMTADEFIAGIPASLTPEALSRAREAFGRRKPGATRLPDTARTAWTAARAQAKRAVLADNDISGVGSEGVWAAVAAAMDAAGAYAVREHIEASEFDALLAPWQYLTGEAA